MSTEKCIVHGCGNEKHQGNFIGDICAPCFHIITTGDASQPSANFIHRLWAVNNIKSKWVNRILEGYNFVVEGTITGRFVIGEIENENK